MKNIMHIINKQTFEIKLPARADCWSLQKKISDVLQKLVYPKLAVICDKHCKLDSYYRINKLEIDLGNIPQAKLRSAILEEIPKQFEKQLISAICDLRSENEDTIIKTTYGLSTSTAYKGQNFNKPDKEGVVTLSPIIDRTNSNAEQTVDRLELNQGSQTSSKAPLVTTKIAMDDQLATGNNVIKKQEIENTLEAIEYFLATGTRSWWSRDNKKWCLSEALSEVSKKEPTMVRFLLSTLNEVAVTRLILQQNDKQLLELTLALLPDLFKDFEILHHNLQQIFVSIKLIKSASRNKLRQHYWSFTLAFASEDQTQKSVVTFIDQLVGYMAYAYQTSRLYIANEIFNAAGNLMQKGSDLAPSLTLWVERIMRLNEADNLTIPAFEDKTHNLPRENIDSPEVDRENIDSSKIGAEDKTLTMSAQIKASDLKSSLYHDKTHNLPRENIDSSKIGAEDKTLTMSAQTKASDLKSSLYHDKTHNLPRENIDSPEVDVADKVLLNDHFRRSKVKVQSGLETIYIDNAGLVLYWIYLKQLFIKTGLVDEKTLAFTDDEARVRAVLLLGTLFQDSVTEIPEHELALNKILCGMKLEEPIPSSFDIKPLEREECAKITLAIIGHWTALKKISSGSFIKMFGGRMGVIKQQAYDRYLLQVERKPQDILLDKLPWSISLIKLPWMQSIMTVEW